MSSLVRQLALPIMTITFASFPMVDRIAGN